MYFCLFHGLGVLGLVGPDEPRYAAIALEMSQSGDWVTPRLHGTPWFEKPILYYWSAAAAFRFLGVSEFTARLPSALAAVMAALVLAWTARRFYGSETAHCVLLILPACVACVGFGRAATTDMLFAAALTAAMCSAMQIFFAELPSTRMPRCFVLFGASLGIAALAKGPAAIVLAGGSFALWIVFTRRWRDALRALHPVGIAAFAVVAAPWYVLCALRNPEFFGTFFVAHNVERFLTPVFRHEQPWWFFGPILMLGLLPWTVLLALPLRDAVELFRRRAWSNSPALFAACWVIFPVVFFSLSRSKLPGYALPAIAPLVFLIARGATRSSNGLPRAHRAALCAVGGTFVAVAMSATYWLTRLPPESPVGAENIRLLVLIVGSLGAGIAVLGLYGRLTATRQASALLIALMVASFNWFYIPALDAHLSPRATAELLRPASGGNEAAVHELHRAWHYGLNFYQRRALPEWTPQMPPETLIVASDAGIQNLLERGYRVMVVKRVAERATVVRAVKD